MSKVICTYKYKFVFNLYKYKFVFTYFIGECVCIDKHMEQKVRYICVVWREKARKEIHQIIK